MILLNETCKVVEEGGNFVIQMVPKVVTATDEDELAARGEEENAKVEGEDDKDNGLKISSISCVI